jgi:hypothetical protein
MNWQPTGNRLQILEEVGKGGIDPYLWSYSCSLLGISRKREIDFFFDGVAPIIDSWKSRLKSDLLLLVHRIKDSLHSSILDIVATL